MVSKWLKWQPGRQQGGYAKMLLATGSRPIPFDAYFLQFPQTAVVPTHIDKVESGHHYRLNIILKRARRGGEFVCESTIINWSRVKLFRPDLYAHSVTEVVEGNRYVLSIGWVLKSKLKN